MDERNQRAIRLRAYQELCRYAPTVDRPILERFATANIESAMRLAAEVAHVTVMARAIDPRHEAHFNAEIEGLIRIGAAYPREARVLLNAGIRADMECPHPPDVHLPSEVYRGRTERVMQCLG